MKTIYKSLVIIIVMMSVMSCAKQVVPVGNGIYRVKPKNSFRHVITDDTCIINQAI